MHYTSATKKMWTIHPITTEKHSYVSFLYSLVSMNIFKLYLSVLKLTNKKLYSSIWVGH
jgi:hypothetical protein